MIEAQAVSPSFSGWLYVICAAGILLTAFNLWRFRTGWRMTGEHHRAGYTELAISVGYASVPGMVAMVGMMCLFLLFPLAERYESAALGYGVLLGAALFAGGMAVSITEYHHPSRWNPTPRWLQEARARGEIEG